MDDNPADVDLAREAFSEPGTNNNLHVVMDGVEALAFLRQENQYAEVPRPDLILLDLNLPMMNGREVLAEIKQDPDLKRIPVAILTSSADDGDILTCYDLHANCYIRKSHDVEDVFKRMLLVESFWLGVVTLPPR